MYEIFNMGIGMVLAVEATEADEIMAKIQKQGETVYRIGEVVPLETEKVEFAEATR